MNMKKTILRLFSLFLALMIPLGALSERVYLIADSNRRLLTESELWEWDYESLGYILNEIFARHGYVFKEGGVYDQYFSAMPWYTPNADSNNSRACYSQLNSVEWENEGLVKLVRQEMREMGTTNPRGKSVWDDFYTGFDTLQGFDGLSLKSGQKLAVYSAPSSRSWRGADGKASVSTNGAIYCAGWESGWLLVMYETNSGSVRVGYVNPDNIKGKISIKTQLNFAYTPATLQKNTYLTDDPARNMSRICTLRKDMEVTYLTTFYNQSGWDYIETTLDGQTVRGFVPVGSLLDDLQADSFGAEAEDTSEWENASEGNG